MSLFPNNNNVPTLRKIARDIFVILVSTVASESAFSTSGRVLSEHRSRLTPEILEALMCSQDWMRRKYIGIYSVLYISFQYFQILFSNNYRKSTFKGYQCRQA